MFDRACMYMYGCAYAYVYMHIRTLTSRKSSIVAMPMAPPAPSAPHRPAAPCAPLPPDASVCVCRNATLLLAASGRRARLGAAALSHQDGKRVAVALGRGGLPLLAGHAKLQERVTLTARIESHVAPAKLTRHSSALGVECILALRHGFLF